MREVVLKGNAYERGFQHGQLFTKDIQESTVHFRHELSNRAILSVMEQTVAFLDVRFPEINEEIRGISDGANAPFQDLFLLWL